MSFDLIVKDGVLPDGRQADIGIRAGRIAEIAPAIDAFAAEVIVATGKLVSPPFVDAHFHMDSTLSYGRPRVNASGTLLEGIALWGELKRIQTRDEIVARALDYCRQAVGQGVLAIRSHVDVTDPTFHNVEALLEVRERVRGILDLQLVAFPQDGWFRTPQGEAQVVRALDAGVDIVGGIPHFERTAADGAASVRAACRLAAERGLMVDLHCDESDDPLSRHIETLAAETVAFGLQGRVAGSHLSSMHSMDNYYVAKLLPLIAEAQVAAIPNPLINITLQGRMDTYPKRRGMTRVPELLAAGVTVAFGQDCVKDPWYPLGSGDMLDVAHMGLHVALMTAPDQMRLCFDMVTATPARIMGLGFGLHTGARGSLVVLDCSDPIEAIRLRPARLAVVSDGNVVSRTVPKATEVAGFLAKKQDTKFRSAPP
jgi:cytosine/creatinine deaminase